MKDTVKSGAIVQQETNVSRGFDGNGNLLRDATSYYCNGCQPPANTLNYYVRSSVIGEVVLTVGGQGQRLKSYVYNGHVLVATQYGPGVWQWQQRSPIGTTDWYTQQNLATSLYRIELDAAGADTKTSDPYPPGGGEDPNSSLVSEDLLTRFGDATDLVGGCYVDHIIVPCTLMMKYINHGGAGSPGGGILGFVNIWEDTYNPEEPDPERSHGVRNVGYLTLIPISAQRGQKNPHDPTGDLLDFLKNNPKCAELLNSLYPTHWESGDQAFGSVFDLVSFVDVTEHSEVLDKTLSELGGDGGLTIRGALTSAYAYTITETQTVYLNESHFNSQAERGPTVFHEILAHAGLRSKSHVDAAARLGISYTAPAEPKPKRNPFASPNLPGAVDADELRKYKSDLDRAASGAIDDWIKRGCQ